MRKTEVYSWRVAFDLKRSLEEAAKAEKISLAQLLERIVLDWLAKRSKPDGQEEKVQRQLHKSAAQAFGTIHGSDPNRSQEQWFGQKKKSFRQRSYPDNRVLITTKTPTR